MGAVLLSLDEVLSATGGRLARPPGDAASAAGATAWDGVTIDGRTARPGDLYFAVRGEAHDGHRFCGQAAQAGATGVVVEKGRTGEALAQLGAAGERVAVIEVDDGRLAIGRVGRAIRRRWGGLVVGVTGSTGKTTTKGLIAAALAGVAGDDAVLATEGSLNNETGVPLTLARLRPAHRFAVVEMGMRGVGQIDYLCDLVEPDVGVVVNAGMTHVGVVGSIEAIARGKSEIWNRLGARGHAILPAGDPRLGALAAEKVPDAARRITFGHEPNARVRVRDIEVRGPEGSDVWLDVDGRRLRVRVPLVGRHNADNAACAVAVALALDLDLEKAAAGIPRARPGKMRAEVVQVGGRNVLLDCYNANPTSMRAGIETLGELAGDHRAVAVLGDMLELGDEEQVEHEKLAAILKEQAIDALVAIGERMRHAARAALDARLPHIAQTDDPVLAARTVASWTDPGDWILVKASRGMRLERVIDALREVVA